MITPIRKHTHRSRRIGLVALILLAALLVVMAAPSGVAYADAGPTASCMGHEASAISPPGSSEEFPGGMPALREWAKENLPGVPFGQVIKIVASLHEGSHEACDEALEG